MQEFYNCLLAVDNFNKDFEKEFKNMDQNTKKHLINLLLSDISSIFIKMD